MPPQQYRFHHPVPAAAQFRAMNMVRATLPRDLAARAVPVGPGRVEEAEQRFPSHTPLMLLLSLAYVVVALAFGARVLDAVGTGISDTQLNVLAAWNHTLFGCAIALGLWGACALPWMEASRLSWRWRWLILVSAGVAGMALSVALQRGAVTWMIEKGRTRRKGQSP